RWTEPKPPARSRSCMRLTRASQGRHRGADDDGKGNDAVLAALGVAHDDPVVAELEVLDAQTQALEQAHAGAVEKRRDEALGSLHETDDAAHLRAREHRRESAGALGADDG